MKKSIFFLILFFVTKIAFSQTIQTIINEKNCSFAVILQDKDNSYISTVLYSPNNQKPQIGFEGGGIWTVSNQYEEDDKYIFIKIINRWIGNEELEENDKRNIFIYNCILEKEKLINELSKGKSGFRPYEYHLKKESMYLSFLAEDNNGTIAKKPIYTKLNAKLRKEPSNNSQILQTFSLGVPEVELQDIVLSKNEQTYLLVEIDKLKGYLSFDEIQDNWSIKINRLKFSFNNKLTVKENLKLREEENQKSKVLEVLSNDTVVRIIGIGKEEKIDNIDSNWVKVEILQGKNKEGKDISPGIIGWCYGGYLK